VPEGHVGSVSISAVTGWPKGIGPYFRKWCVRAVFKLVRGQAVMLQVDVEVNLAQDQVEGAVPGTMYCPKRE